MAKTLLKSLLVCICILLPPTAKGANESCVASLRNTVVYEGTRTIMFNCSTEPNSLAWSVKPISNYYTSYTIADFDSVVPPTLKEIYAVQQSALIVRNATTTPTSGPITSAGLYFVKFPSTTDDYAMRLVVIRSGPTCSCYQSDSNAMSVSCSIIYADHQVSPSNVIMKWTQNGQSHATVTATRSSICPLLYNSTSTITVNNAVTATYVCKVTFGSPSDDNNKSPVTEWNAPDLSATCTGCDGIPTKQPTTNYQPILEGGLPEGSKIGLGVGIGVGGVIISGGIALFVLCMIRHRIKRTILDDEQRADSMRSNTNTPPFEPRNLAPNENDDEPYDIIQDTEPRAIYDTELPVIPDKPSPGYEPLEPREPQQPPNYDTIRQDE